MRGQTSKTWTFGRASVTEKVTEESAVDSEIQNLQIAEYIIYIIINLVVKSVINCYKLLAFSSQCSHLRSLVHCKSI